MGSFTELVLAFTFRPEVPTEILAAFGGWRTGDGPPLPDFGDLVAAAEDDDDDLELDELEDMDEEDLTELSPLQKAIVVGGLAHGMWTAYFPGQPGVQLVSQGSHWNLTMRTHHKSTAADIWPRVAALGAFACPAAAPARPEFVGYMKYEGDDRPVLVWHRGGDRFELEDPNPR